MQTLELKIDGKDEISVTVENGIAFEGIVMKAEMTGSRFVIEGRVTDGICPGSQTDEG